MDNLRHAWGCRALLDNNRDSITDHEDIDSDVFRRVTEAVYLHAYRIRRSYVVMPFPVAPPLRGQWNFSTLTVTLSHFYSRNISFQHLPRRQWTMPRTRRSTPFELRTNIH
jgi:hypothetical protein